MKNKIVLITGSTDGIGLQTAMDLAGLGARVLVQGRNLHKAQLAVEQVMNRSNNKEVEAVSADLGSFESIRGLARDIRNRYEKIDVLINNAGVFMNEKEYSRDGYEMTFAINHLAYFLLTGLLLDLIKKSDYARIVNVASMAHAGFIDFENLQAEKHFEGYDAYSRSKLCNILFTFKLAELLTDSQVTANVLHPGVIGTKLLHAGWGGGGADWDQGSKTSVFLASSADLTNISGQYFSNLKPVKPAAIAYDKSIQNELWKKSETMTGLQF